MLKKHERFRRDPQVIFQPPTQRETAKFAQGWDAYSLGVLTPGQTLLSNKPELKVQTPEDSQNLNLKHPALAYVQFKVAVLHILKGREVIYPRWELLCSVDPAFLPMTGTCSAAVKTPNITHKSSGEGVCTLANLLCRNMCAEEHPPRVCAVPGGRALFDRTASSSGRG